MGGHNARDLDSGRIFRVAPPGHQYQVPKFDFATAAGAVEALKSPNYAVRYVAWTALRKMDQKAEDALTALNEDKNPRYRARALWLLSQIKGRGEKTVKDALQDKNPDIRIVGIRMARQLNFDIVPIAKQLIRDPSAQVRREVAIALRHNKSDSDAESLG